MTSTPTYSLEALERRWELEKTPQVGLRLAEQYRLQDKISAAIETLAAGLEVYPTHTASRVALSRYLVDTGRLDEAVPHLEQIVMRDPAHLVGNKLLVEAYAGVGRTDEAREKLAVYEMMGAGDADIERLAELLEAEQRRGDSESAELDPAGGSGPVPTEVSEGIKRGTDQPFGRPTGLDTLVARVPVAAAVPDEADQPFAPALAPGKLSDYWQKVADEGIFTFHRAEEPEQPAAVGDSTVTLGELYWEQGHREEAVEVFEDVIAREPENQSARRGLEVTREPVAEAGPGAPPASAAGDADASEDGSTPGLVERKKLALITYLERIRQADASGI